MDLVQRIDDLVAWMSIVPKHGVGEFSGAIPVFPETLPEKCAFAIMEDGEMLQNPRPIKIIDRIDACIVEPGPAEVFAKKYPNEPAPRYSATLLRECSATAARKHGARVMPRNFVLKQGWIYEDASFGTLLGHYGKQAKIFFGCERSGHEGDNRLEITIPWDGEREPLDAQTVLHDMHRKAGVIANVRLDQYVRWSVRLAYDGCPSVTFVTDPHGVCETFKLRDIPNGHSRRKALLHWVSEHWRRKRNSPEDTVKVRAFIRGERRFVWNNMTCHIQPSAEAELGSKKNLKEYMAICDRLAYLQEHSTDCDSEIDAVEAMSRAEQATQQQHHHYEKSIRRVLLGN